MKMISTQTKADAQAARDCAKLLGYKIRVAKTGRSLRMIGLQTEVRDVATFCGFTSASGQSPANPTTVPVYADGMTEFFAYKTNQP
jgi:hypothetical protein